jgi:hypothetical protein
MDTSAKWQTYLNPYYYLLHVTHTVVFGSLFDWVTLIH